MGIVSFCPSGHRVKVKEHLAGKNGICPTCGAKFRIPLVSVGAPSPVAATKKPAGLPVAAVVSLDPDVAATLPPALAFSPAPESAPAEVVPQSGGPLPDVEQHDMKFTSFDMLEPATSPDVITEAPDATWCVAVPGGEPSEPMTGETLLAWLTEGHATGGELVWRSDWPEWRAIRQVFPDHVPNLPSGGFPSW